MTKEKNLKQLNNEIQAALKNKDWSAAVLLLKEWCDRRPDDAKAWYYHSFALYQSGRLSEAETSAARVLSMDPDHKDAQNLLSILSAQRGTSTNLFKDSQGLWRPGDIVEGRYEIRDSKKGGMGEVYFAFDRELDRMVAIKTPLPSVFESEPDRARFLREADAWIGLGIHPNICSAYYVQEIDGLSRLFIEYVAGGTLGARLKNNPDLSFRIKMDLAIQIAAGMSHTHTFPWKDEEGHEHRGLVHRDLKPANILIEEDGTARITDFGLVGRSAGRVTKKNQGPKNHPPPDSDPTRGVISGTNAGRESANKDLHWKTMTVAGAAMGTPPYMAPEQWQAAHDVGFPADVYAFGCILYEIFCGRRPFLLADEVSESMSEVQMFHWELMHTRSAPPNPLDFNPDLDEELSELMTGCLDKDPALRPDSFETLRETLKSIYRRVEGWRVPFLRPEPKASRLVPGALNNQGYSFITIGRAKRAEEVWRDALKADPHHVEAAYNMALYGWRRLGVSAQETCRRMAEVSRTHADSWRSKQLLGRMYLFFGDYPKAVESLKQALDIDPAAPNLRKDLGLSLCAKNAASGDPAIWVQAERLFREAIERDLGDFHVISGLYLALKRQGREDEARRFYSQSSKRYPDLPSSPEEAVFRFVPGHEIVYTISLPGRVDALTICADGRRAVIGNKNEITRWALRPIDPERIDSRALSAGDLNELAFGANERYALSASSDGRLCLWEAGSERPLREISHPGGRIASLALSPEGDFAATVDGHGTIRLWNLHAEMQLKSWESPVGITKMACGPKGECILTGHKDLALRLWEGRSGKLLHTLLGHETPVTAITLTSDGRSGASGGKDGTWRLWNLESGDLEKVLRLDGAVQAMAVSPDARLSLVALADDQAPDTTRLSLMVLTGKSGYYPAYTVTMPISAAKAEALEKEFQENMAEAKSHMAREYFHEAFEYICRARALGGYSRDPEAMELSLDLASRFPNKSLLTAWELSTLEGPEDEVASVAVTPDGARVLSGGSSGKLRIWDIETARLPKVLTGHTKGIASVAVDAAGQWALTAAADNTLRLWSLKTPRCHKVLSGQKETITSAAISPDGRYALSGTREGTLLLWDLDKETVQPLKGHTDSVNTAAFSPDGRYAVSGSRDKTIRLWNLGKKTCLRTMEGHTQSITAAAFSPDGHVILSGGEDRAVKVWTPGESVQPRTFTDHESTVNTVAFDPEGRYFLSGSEDRTMRLYELKTGKCVRTFEGHHDGITAVAFAPDGRFAASAGRDKTVRLWRLDWEPEVRNISFWDETARPFLETFLTLHTPYHKGSLVRKGKASWNDDDFQNLVEELRHRGFGWLRPQGVRNELDEMTRYWDGPLDAAQDPGEAFHLKDALWHSIAMTSKTAAKILSKMDIILPALILLFSLANLKRHGFFPVTALMMFAYFIIRIAILLKR